MLGARPAVAVGLLLAFALVACCPPGVTTATNQADALSGEQLAASRGYGFALLGQAAGGSDPDGPAGGEPAGSSGTAEDVDLGARFESAWGLVAERYWDLDGLAVDWDEVGERYRARLPDLDGPDELYALLEEMYEEIGDNHSVYVPPARVAEIRESYGDLPCVAVFDSSAWLSPGVSIGVRAQAPGLATDSLGPVEYGLASEGDLDIGYVRLADLASDGVAAGLRGAVQRLAGSGADAFVLDLRGNPGGRLVTMMQAAGVFTRGFLWRAVMSWTFPLPYPAIGDPVTDRPLAVLIDGGVNSAAEGLAGALQANDRAVLIGETTAGNVEAVLPFCLRDGSQAWIATGVLAPLLGATWEGRGVVPDVEAPSADAYQRAVEHLRETIGGGA